MTTVEPPNPNRRQLVLSAALMFLLIMLSGGMGVFVLTDKSLHSSLLLAQTAVVIQKQSNGDLDWDQMFLSGVQSMTDKLDRYSSYIEPTRFQQMDEEFTGAYGGIGVSVIGHESGLLIMLVREHGPGQRVGLLSGDIIIKADSVQLAGMSANECTKLLRGPEDTRVTVTLFRPVTKDTIVVDITRRRIDLLHIPYAGITADSLIYIRILDFGAGTSDDVANALDSLLAERPGEVRGILLDLHGNPGGLFSEAYNTANLFLDEGQLIVGTDGRSRWRDKEYRSTGVDKTGGLPLAIIVDRGSASAAEIVAGSLRQLKRGILVGDTTFGKGLVQGFSGFPDGSGLRLTVSRYFLEGNVYLNEFDSSLNDVGHGLVPDYYLNAVDREPFPIALENSLLLRKFAAINQDEIVALGGQFSPGKEMIDRFKKFTMENGFVFVSRPSLIARSIVTQTLFEGRRPRTIASAQRLLRLSRDLDKAQFARYTDYIGRRLRQLAYERTYGLARAYAEVIVPGRPQIRQAAEILRETR